jgi:hypothetical protein
MGLIFLYAPSHKRWNNSDNNTDDQPTNNGEETEFSVSSVSAAAGDVSESLPLADFIRHARTD